VRRALEGLNGVKKAEVSMRNRQAVVYFEDGEVNADQMIKAVRRVGFRASKRKGPL